MPQAARSANLAGVSEDKSADVWHAKGPGVSSGASARFLILRDS